MNTTIIKLITLIILIVTGPLKVHIASVQNHTDDTIEKRYAIKGNPALPPSNFKLDKSKVATVRRGHFTTKEK